MSFCRVIQFALYTLAGGQIERHGLRRDVALRLASVTGGDAATHDQVRSCQTTCVTQKPFDDVKASACKLITGTDYQCQMRKSDVYAGCALAEDLALLQVYELTSAFAAFHCKCDLFFAI